MDNLRPSARPLSARAPVRTSRRGAQRNLITTDANGQYTLTNLQPGPTRLVASLGARFIADQETVTVLSGQTVHQDFVLVRKGTTG